MNAFTPRDYQLDCVLALANARAEGHNKALMVMASGLGKTYTVALDIETYLEEHPGASVLVLCHSLPILYQLKGIFQELFGEEKTYGEFTGAEKTEEKTDFLFASLQSVNRHLNMFKRDAYDYVLVDEAHHSAARTYKRAIRHFTPQFLLGMTATPDRPDGESISEIFGETVYEYPLEAAVKDGWLSAVDYHIKADEIARLEEYLEKEEALTLSALNRAIFVPKRDEEIIRIIQEEIAVKDNPTMVIFCQTIQHAEHIASLMDGAIVIHSGLDANTVTERLEGFRSGRIRTVCAVDMLNEGIDVPRTDVVVFLRVTQSQIVFSQQLGRGLRLVEGKDSVLVLDFVATADRLEMLFQFEQDYSKATVRYPGHKKDTKSFLTIETDTPVFEDRKVDILELIARARNSCQHYTDDELITMLREFGEKHDCIPTHESVNADPSMPNATTYANRFGSFSKACKIAGFGILPNNKRYTDEELLECLHVCYERVGRVPTSADLKKFPDMPSAVSYRNRFGGLMIATEMAGLGKSRGAYDLTNEEMAELYLEFAKELGRRPYLREIMKNPKLPSPGCYKNRFGSLMKLADSLGLPKDKSVYRYSDAELIDLLIEFAKKKGHTPTTSEITEDPDMPNADIYSRRFSSFASALKLAGLPPRFSDMDNESLAKLLWDYGQKNGRVPSKRDVDKDPNVPNSALLVKRFGSFSKAVYAAGFDKLASSGRKK